MKTRTHKTKEVEINVSYKGDNTGCGISVIGTGDLKHHLIEELIFLLANEFDMTDHLDIVWRNIKAKSDLFKEV